MLLNNNKKLLSLFNFLIGAIFFIPILICKLNRKKISNFYKILIVELWGVGDLVNLSVVLKDIRNSFPEAEITLLSKPAGLALFKEDPNIDKNITFDFPWTNFKGKYKLWNWDWKGLISAVANLRREKFDLLLDARGDIRSNLLSFFIAAKKSVGYDWTGGGCLLTDVVYQKQKYGNYYEENRNIDSWKNLLTYLGVEVDDLKPRLYISNDEDCWANSFLAAHNIKNGDLFIGIHPGARVKAKCWPLDRFAKIAEHARDNYNAKIIVFIEPSGYGEDISISGEFIKVKVSLRQLMALTKQLNFLICNDSGAMHIASAVNTAVVAIFGPSDPRVWFHPHNDNSSLIIKEGIACRPCYGYCEHKNNFCIADISVPEVLEVVDKKLTTFCSL